MNVPQIQHLHSQSFNSEFVEFVWEFPNDNTQIVFHVKKDGNILLQENEKLDEVYNQKYITSGILTTKNLSYETLAELRDSVVEYLK